MPSALIFGFDCPHCGSSHILSSLGVESQIGDHPIEPTLGMVEEEGQEDLVAICGFCSGLFGIDLMVSMPNQPQPRPSLSLAPLPKPKGVN